jgi:4-aminobutyrate aminotransferase
VPTEDADLAYFEQLEYLFDTLVLPDEVAAILMESMIGEGGYLVPTARWVRKVRELCDRYGILLIMDEIQSGAGRTGTMWCFEHYGVVPDIMTSAKGLGSGMPVSAMVSSREIMDKWAPGAHGSTYGGNAVATAAVVATLEVIKDEHLVDNAARMGKLLFNGLKRIQADYPVIGDVRGLGLMVAAEFVHPDKSPNPEAVARVIESCFQDKLLLISCGTYEQAIRVIPPLIVNEGQIREFLDIFRSAVAKL